MQDRAFIGDSPDAAALSRRWHAQLDEGRIITSRLPGEHAGTCVLGPDGRLCRDGPEALTPARLAELRFREGSIRGALPRVTPP